MDVYDDSKIHCIDINTEEIPKSNDRWYICKTCVKYLQKNEMPPLNVNNGLELDEMDEELDLTELEQTLIAKKILFLKLHVRNPSQIWHFTGHYVFPYKFCK